MSTLDRLVSATYFTLWLFLWDDEQDGEDNDISIPFDHEKMSSLHNEELAYIAFHLGLDEAAEEPCPPTTYTSIFEFAARGFKEHCDVIQRQRIYDEIKAYFNCCAKEAEYLHTGTLPRLCEYWPIRLGTSAISVYAALVE